MHTKIRETAAPAPYPLSARGGGASDSAADRRKCPLGADDRARGFWIADGFRPYQRSMARFNLRRDVARDASRWGVSSRSAPPRAQRVEVACGRAMSVTMAASNAPASARSATAGARDTLGGTRQRPQLEMDSIQSAAISVSSPPPHSTTRRQPCSLRTIASSSCAGARKKVKDERDIPPSGAISPRSPGVR